MLLIVSLICLTRVSHGFPPDVPVALVTDGLVGWGGGEGVQEKWGWLFISSVFVTDLSDPGVPRLCTMCPASFETGARCLMGW